MKTLVVAPNWVGDTVLALPVLEALAGAGREPAVLARPHLHPLLRLCPAVGELLERRPSDAETVEILRRAAGEEAVILPGSFRSAWLAFRAGVPRRWGYRGNFRSGLLRPAVDRGRRRDRHQVDDYRELLGAMGLEAGSHAPRLELSRELVAAGEALRARAGITSGGGPLVGLFPGAEFGPSKRWPWQRYAALARDLRRRRPDLRLLTLVGPKEVWLGVRIHEETARIVPVVGPDQDLAGVAALLAGLDLLVTNDSGPMHLAAALGVPCVALFGPTDPGRTRPRGGDHRVLSTDRWCSPCFRRRCPLIHHRCLRDIEVAGVVEACLGMLAPGAG